MLWYTRTRAFAWQYIAKTNAKHDNLVQPASMCSMAVFRGGHLWDPPLCPVSPTLHNITPALWHNGAFTQRHSLRMHSCTLCLLAGEGLPSLSSSYAISVDFSFGVRPSLHPCLPSSPPSFRVSSNFSLCPLPGSWLVVSRFSISFKAHPVLTKLAVRCLILSITDIVIFPWSCIPTTCSITPEGF